MVVKYFFLIFLENIGCDFLIFFKYIGICIVYLCVLVIFWNILYLLLDCVNFFYIYLVDKDDWVVLYNKIVYIIISVVVIIYVFMCILLIMIGVYKVC